MIIQREVGIFFLSQNAEKHCIFRRLPICEKIFFRKKNLIFVHDLDSTTWKKITKKIRDVERGCVRFRRGITHMQWLSGVLLTQLTSQGFRNELQYWSP
jgi:hypothetical protein